MLDQEFNLLSAILPSVDPIQEESGDMGKPYYEEMVKRGKLKPRGGSRPGAGRPKGLGKFGRKTKAVRVPEEYAEIIPELISNLEQLHDVLQDYKERGSKGSARYDFCNKLINQIEALGFLDII
jgi:hypothetical protein